MNINNDDDFDDCIGGSLLGGCNECIDYSGGVLFSDDITPFDDDRLTKNNLNELGEFAKAWKKYGDKKKANTIKRVIKNIKDGREYEKNTIKSGKNKGMTYYKIIPTGPRQTRQTGKSTKHPGCRKVENKKGVIMHFIDGRLVSKDKWNQLCEGGRPAPMPAKKTRGRKPKYDCTIDDLIERMMKDNYTEKQIKNYIESCYRRKVPPFTKEGGITTYKKYMKYLNEQMPPLTAPRKRVPRIPTDPLDVFF